MLRLTIYLLNILILAHAKKNLLKKIKLQDPTAVCNDGSQGIYYIQHDPMHTKWILFLEGGGACSSSAECEERSKTKPYFTSSRSYPETIEGRNLFDDVYFNDHNKVLLVYCSSDFWLGNYIENEPILRDSISENHKLSVTSASVTIPDIYDNETATNKLNETKSIVPNESESNNILNVTNSYVSNKTVVNEFFSIKPPENNDSFDDNITKSSISGFSNENFKITSTKLIPVINMSYVDLNNTRVTVNERKALHFDSGAASHSNDKNFFFRGVNIFKSVVCDLMRNGLNSSSTILLAGSSAGGIGAINHADYLKKKTNVTVFVMIDSSWLINYNNVLNNLNYSGIMKTKGCHDFSLGFPCCLSTSCMITQQYISPSIHILAIVSKYDVYSVFPDKKFDNTRTLFEVLTEFQAYGGQLTYSISLVEAYKSVSYLVTTCMQHVYLATSDLWKNVYNSKTEENFQGLKFKHIVDPVNFRLTQINGNSAEDLFLFWYKEVSNNSSSGVTENFKLPLRRIDPCKRLQCNTSSCPIILFPENYIEQTSNWQRTLLITVILTIVIVAYCIKLSWMYHNWKLKKTQSIHLAANKDSTKEESSTCLPPCPPHSSIGISCSKLTYNITSATQTESDPRNRNGIKIQKPFTKLRRKSALDAGRKIIKGVSAYFNPGQLVAIMGPSGSGKTTLLDVLTARKNFKEAEKHIFINGLPADETREWFIKNSGYVLQLATPYHEQLTVRQNLTYSAMLRLPSKMKLKEKMWRVEQILGQTGLFNVADVVVGGNTSKGSGLSGGQKRRLCVGLQLVDLPSVIFLDEPTSGLDSASSLELLEMLHGLTLSGRLVVVTIHQPRIEIFHMFDTILFLCDGQAAYFGSPLMAPTMIAEALQGSGKIADSSNPADTIMDVLNNTELQCIIVDHYNHSGEIEGINRAIARAKRHPQKTLSMKFQKQTSSISDRLIALDGRSSSSQTFAQKLYFPLIFMLFALALGTCYFKTKKAVLLMSCYMVFLCASQLFMSSVIHAHLNKAFALFSLEKADGIGFSHELVLHAFIRIFSQSSISLLGACVIIYLCVLKVYDTEKFFLTSVIHLQLNQVWIALIICIACLTPNYSHLVTPIASAIAGFAGGFLVPEPQMPIFYYWLFYINPTHWAYCGTMFVLMRNMTDCKNETIIECQQNTGAMTLKDFGLHKSNPYRSMLVLLAMLVSLLTMSVVVLEITHAKKKWKKVLGNSLKSIKLNCVSYYQSFRDHLNEKKKKRKEAERQRLFELAEQKYTYKSPLTSNDTSFVEVCNGDVLIGNDEKIKKETASVDDVLEETEDSSNDEDHYDYVTQNFLDVQKEPKSRLNGSFTSFFSKIQHFNRSGNSSEDKTEMKVKVHFRRKNQKKTKGDKFKDRRKTFSGVITEHSNQQDKPSKRPASVSGEPFRSERNSQMGSPFEKLKYFNNDFQKLSSSKEALKLERQCLDMPQSENERGNEFQKTLQLISHGCLLHDKEAKTKNDQNNVYPPDIVIDIDQNLEAERRIHSTKTEENKRPKQKKKKRDTRNESKSIDTWSKYLDTASRRHEVYCALSSVKRRLKSSKRGSEHVERESIIKKDEILQRTASFIKKDGTLQRKTSLLILREKQMSMRSQLQEFQQQLSQDGSISPVAEKQMQLIRTRNKYRRLPHNSNEDENTVDETISQEAVKSSRREFIERLSLLSSGRSSNVSNLCESNRNTYDGSRTSYEANATVDKEPNTNIYEDTVYEDFEDQSRRPYSLYSNEIKYRENDPLLPDERALVEGLLNKYAHLETSIRDRASCLQEHPSVPSRLTFSSGVKIKGLSPNHSRKTSRVERNSSSSFNRDQNSEALAMSKLDEEDDETKQQGHNLNNNDNNTLNGEGLVNSDDNVFTKNDSEKSQIKSFSTSSVSRTSDVTSPISNRKQMSTLQVKPLIVNKETEKSRKISITVKSVARVEKPTEIFDNENSSNPTSSDYEDEDPDNQIESPRITESQQEEMLRMYKKENFFKDRNEKTKKKKKRESLAPETDYDSGSTSSDYEENFVKTEEGFIIPDDTISKVIASSTMGAPNTRLGRRRGSQNQQSEIEKMFKKDNYLKDRSNKRGIRMPIGSAGKVNQLLSKFENNKNMKANLTSNRTRRSLEKLNEKNATQRPFFKVLKTPKPNAPSNTQTQRPIYSSSSSDEEEKVEASRSSLKQKRPRKISEHLENINE